MEYYSAIIMNHSHTTWMNQKIIMLSEIAKHIEFFKLQHLLGDFCPDTLPTTSSTLFFGKYGPGPKYPMVMTQS